MAELNAFKNNPSKTSTLQEGTVNNELLDDMMLKNKRDLARAADDGINNPLPQTSKTNTGIASHDNVIWTKENKDIVTLLSDRLQLPQAVADDTLVSNYILSQNKQESISNNSNVFYKQKEIPNVFKTGVTVQDGVTRNVGVSYDTNIPLQNNGVKGLFDDVQFETKTSEPITTSTVPALFADFNNMTAKGAKKQSQVVNQFVNKAANNLSVTGVSILKSERAELRKMVKIDILDRKRLL